MWTKIIKVVDKNHKDVDKDHKDVDKDHKSCRHR